VVLFGAVHLLDGIGEVAATIPIFTIMQTNRPQLPLLLAALSLALLAGSPAQAGLTAAQQTRANAALLFIFGDQDGPWDLVGLSKIKFAPVKAALDSGADVKARLVTDATPLMVAVEAGNLACVKLLVSRGANVNAKDELGNSALIYAVFDADARKFWRFQDDSAYVAFLKGVEASSASIVRYLVIKGANMDVKDHDGQTALSAAHGHPKISAILKAAGAKE